VARQAKQAAVEEVKAKRELVEGSQEELGVEANAAVKATEVAKAAAPEAAQSKPSSGLTSGNTCLHSSAWACLTYMLASAPPKKFCR
jgi:hypothetical protein